MPIIKDGNTPNGRFVACKKSVDSTGECRVRKMTEEERAIYGDPVPPKDWGKPPQRSEYWSCKTQRRVMTFKDDDDFRRKMKHERLRKNLTQQRLAEFAGCCKDQVSKVERGAKKPSAEIKKKICKVFGWEVVE